MNSKQIDCILELAQSLNFNRAAENLYITQPTLTYHIKQWKRKSAFQSSTALEKARPLPRQASSFA